MRVIKNGGFAAIAREMLNIELGLYFFTPAGVNRELIDTPTGTSASYPQVQLSSEHTAFVSTYSGTIILPIGFVFDEHALRKEYNALVDEIPQSMRTRVHIQNISCHQNAKKMINIGGFNFNSDRTSFCWEYKTIDRLTHPIDSNFAINDIVRDVVSSILYDPESVTVFADNALVFEFCKENLVGNKFLTGLNLTLCDLSDQLTIEMSEHWSKTATNGDIRLRNIPPTKVFACNKDRVKWVVPPDTCTRCRSTLYGSFYGLSYEISVPTCWAFCALCVHNAEPFEEPLEKQFSIICKFISDRAFVSDKKTDLLRELDQGIVQRESYALIGTRYVGVYDIDDAIYSTLGRSEDFNGRLICKLVNIKFS